MRWSADADRIEFFLDDRLAPSRPAIAYVFYDPRCADRLHVNLLRHDVPVCDIKLMHAGHPAGVDLAEIGLLSAAVLDIVNGKFDATTFERLARTRRRNSGKYLANLSGGLSECRFALQFRLARAAVAAAPHRPDYAEHLAILLDEAGSYEEANQLYQRSIIGHNSNPLRLKRYSSFLMRHGKLVHAIKFARAAHEAAPNSIEAHRHLARLLSMSGDYQEAQDMFRRAAALGRSMHRSVMPSTKVLRLQLAATVMPMSVYAITQKAICAVARRRRTIRQRRLQAHLDRHGKAARE
jgi:tetratricopeptide (TPR) repeat protein